MTRALRFSLALALICYAVRVLPQTSDATPAATPVPPASIDAAGVQARLQAAQNHPSLDEAARTSVVSLYTQALDKLREAEQWRAAALEFENALQATPALLEAIRDDIARLEEAAMPDPATMASLPLLESRLIELESQLAREQATLTSLEGEFQRRTDRRIAVPALRAAARQRMTEIETQIAAAESGAEPSDEASAFLTLQRSRLQSAQAEIESYDLELRSYEARGELLPARRDLAALRVARTERAVRAWREAVNERRREEAEEATRLAREQASRVHPVAGEIAVENESLARQRSGPGGYAARIEQVSNELHDTETLLARVTGEFESVRSKVEAIGRSEAVGYLLRSKRAELPSLHRYARRNKARQSEIRSIQLRQIQLSERRSGLADGMNTRLQEILGGLDTNLPVQRRSEIELTLRGLLQTQQTLLDALIRDVDRYFTLQIDLDTREKALIDGTRAFQAYIDERILWVPSGDPFGAAEWRDAGRALLWLIHPAQWHAAARGLGGAGWEQMSRLLPSLLLIVLLIALRASLRGRLQREGQTAIKGSTRTILPTVNAGVLTLLLALTRPAAVGWLAWLLSSSPTTPEFAGYIAAGLTAVALVDLLIEMLRSVASRHGLGENHFGWPPRAMQRVRVALRWSSWAGLPLVFLYAGLQAQPDNAWRESLGRLALVGLVMVLALATRQLIHPRTGVFAESLRLHPDSWGSRLQRFGYPLVVGLPLGLAVIALGGYTYTAYHLAQRLYGTAWLFIVLLLLYAAGLRWLLMARRRLVLEQNRKRREAAVAELRTDREAASAPETAAISPEVEVDFASLDSQARQILRVALGFAFVLGLWWVWVDVLPALNVLGRIELWNSGSPGAATERVLSGPLNAAGETAPPTVTDGAGEGRGAVTLADLGLSLIFLVLTLVGVRNFPGLLQIALLQRLNLETSVRFAITTLSRYVLMMVGTVAVLGSMGIGWNKLQWLVAAMTVGLGFGLQEIFANFVSGLILLFERPIRIGDTVTVAGTTGQVSQIRMRATTITDFERRDLIVPNKEFITGSLINWTLGSTMTRTHLTVGVAYGTDTLKARALMQKLAEDCEHVLKDPPPFTVFKSFGDNSLELRLYIYLPRTDALWPATNALMTGIDEAFRNEGIAIAFPQRDLHLETTRPLEVRVLPSETTAQD